MSTYIVKIVDDGGDVVKSVECKTLREAEKVERGIMINLNIDEYFTRIEELEK